jgi:hypothetical protein
MAIETRRNLDRNILLSEGINLARRSVNFSGSLSTISMDRPGKGEVGVIMRDICLLLFSGNANPNQAKEAKQN